MTIDEAIALAGRFDRCWIVWHERTGEILSVEDARTTDMAAYLSGLRNRSEPIVARLFESVKVTRDVLTQQALESARVAARTTQLAEWYAAPVEELVTVLESGHYLPPMNLAFDSRIVTDHLWALHRDELTSEQRGRLGSLLGGARLSAEASEHLALYLATLSGQVDPIRASCRSLGPHLCFKDHLLSCVVHLQLAEDGILDSLITCVATKGMFGPRFDAMVALGSLDGAIGTKAPDVIEEHIYESGPHVAAVRTRVLERLRGRDELWETCRHCCHGNVHGPTGFKQPCPECLGLAIVRRGAGLESPAN